MGPPTYAQVARVTKAAQTPKTVQKQGNAVSKLGRQLQVAIKDLPNSMDESDLSWPDHDMSDLIRQLKEKLGDAPEQAGSNSIPASPDIMQNHASNPGPGELYGSHIGSPSTGESESPYMAIIMRNNASSNGQPTVGSAYQHTQMDLWPQIYRAPYFVSPSSTGAAASWSPTPQPMKPQPMTPRPMASHYIGPQHMAPHPYHHFSQNPPGSPDPQFTQQPYPRYKLYMNPQDTCPAPYQGAPAMNNQHISLGLRFTQNMPIAQDPQMAQESQVYGQTPQSHQFQHGRHVELGNDSQQPGGFDPNGSSPQGIEFQQRVGNIPETLARRAQASQRNMRNRPVADSDGDGSANRLPEQEESSQ